MQDVERFMQVYEEIWPSFDADRLEKFARNWAARGDVIFVEYAMEATVNGERLAWDGIGRFRLRDGRVIDAIGRWDTAVIQAALGAQRSTAG
jgi:hypothetical protein